MKLYTKRGDDGSTGLFGGQRVGKDHLRVEAYGCVDELNSFVGLAAGLGGPDEIADILRRVQSDLFDLGADLATPRTDPGVNPGADSPKAGGTPAPPARNPGVQDKVPRIGPDHARQLERWIDAACAPLPPMRQFILPGGTELAARLHVARAVCRRTERLCVALARRESLGPDIIIYLNRLSDLLFALARRANQLAGVADVPWTRAPGSTPRSQSPQSGATP